MFPRETRRTRRGGQIRRRPDQTGLECLEGRELLAYTPLGFSLPDLTVSGYAAPAASWNGTLAVTVTVQNLGASTIREPLALAPGSTSTADSAPTIVEVYLSRTKGLNAKTFPIGAISVPSIPQNSDTTLTQTLTMPAQLPGFPGNGGKVYVSFAVDPFHTIPESDYTNNSSGPKPLVIAAALPALVAVGLDVPPVMQPGDTINPNIRIDNLGPADTAAQGPVTVDLIASTTPTFNSGSTIVASYTVANIPGIQNAPEQSPTIAPSVIPHRRIGEHGPHRGPAGHAPGRAEELFPRRRDRSEPDDQATAQDRQGQGLWRRLHALAQGRAADREPAAGRCLDLGRYGRHPDLPHTALSPPAAADRRRRIPRADPFRRSKGSARSVRRRGRSAPLTPASPSPYNHRSVGVPPEWSNDLPSRTPGRTTA